MPRFVDDIEYPVLVKTWVGGEEVVETQPDGTKRTVHEGGEEVVILDAVVREPDPDWELDEQVRMTDVFAAAGVNMSEAMRKGETFRDAMPRIIASLKGPKGQEALEQLRQLNNERLVQCLVRWDGDEAITVENCDRLPLKARTMILQTINRARRTRDDAEGELSSSSTTSS